MGGSSKTPETPKAKPLPPPPPVAAPITPENPDVQAGAEAVRRRLRGKSGRAGTLLTSESGAKTKLGE